MPIDTSQLERLDVGDKQVQREHINQFIDVLEGMPTAAEAAEITTAVAIATAQLFDVATYGAVRSASDPGSTVKSANLAAMQAAADAAKAADGMLVIKGRYWISGSLSIECHVDGRSGIISQTNATTSQVTLVVGPLVTNTRAFNKYMMLPEVRQEGKSGTGWSGNDIGIQLSNLYQCHVTIPNVRRFSRNLVVSSLGTGNVYNHYYLGISENPKVGLELLPGTGGWVNENTFYGGRFQIDSGEGTNISGARHILVSSNAANSVNNNRFLKPSIEGDGPEYHIDLNDARYNIFDQARYESSPPKVRQTDCDSNVFFYGYNAHAVEHTVTNSPNTHIITRQGQTLFAGGSTTGVLRLSNRSSNTQPAVMVWPTDIALGSQTNANYAASLTAEDFFGKLHSDTAPRVWFDFSAGRVYLGNGAATPVMYLGNFGTVGLQASTYFRVGSVASLPTAGSGYRGMHIRVEGGTGVADVTYQCLKSAADTYSWVVVSTG